MKKSVSPKGVMLELTVDVKNVDLAAVIGKPIYGEFVFVNGETKFKVLSEHLVRISSSYRVMRATLGKYCLLFDLNEVKLLSCLSIKNIDNVPENERATVMWDYIDYMKKEDARKKSDNGLYATQRKYNEKYTVMHAVRLNYKTDADIIAFLEDKPFQPTVKKALRDMMRRGKR